jgi:hypothetical protein
MRRAFAGANRRNGQVSTEYILRLRQMLDTVRKLQPPGQSDEIEQQLAQLERELQEAATEMTIQACRQEVERREPRDRRQTTLPVAVDRRFTPARRDTDLPQAIAGAAVRHTPADATRESQP